MIVKKLEVYESPEISVIEFQIEESITVSGLNNGALLDDWLINSNPLDD